MGSVDSLELFGGIDRLFGRGAHQRLKVSKVMVVGLGGVGSWAAEALARSGVGKVTLVDADEVCVTNTNRQLQAIQKNWGRLKVEAMAERMGEIFPQIEVEVRPVFFNASTAEQLMDSSIQIVIDCIDTLPDKCLLLHLCRQLGLRAVTTGGAGGKRQGTALRVNDLALTCGDPLLRELRRRLRREFAWPEGGPYGIRAVYSTEPPVFPQPDGSCQARAPVGGGGRIDCATGLGTAAFVTGAFGLAAAGEAVKWLLEPAAPESLCGPR